MKTGKLVFRNLIFFRRTNLAIIAGIAIAVAVLSGALLVGQSVRGSLSQLLHERIGATDYVVTSPRFFGESLANSPSPGFRSCPLIYLKGVVTREETGAQVQNVNVYGVDERFWNFHGERVAPPDGDREAFVGRVLAGQLEIQSGDSLLLRVEAPQAIPREWLYGRRDAVGKTIRLRCGPILPGNRLGEFALRPTQGNVFSIFVPIRRLQKDLGQPLKINTILVAGGQPERGLSDFRRNLADRCTLPDLGLQLRNWTFGNGFSLESDRIVLDEASSRAASAAAAETGLPFTPLYTYLANAIRSKGREIPYSVITATDLGSGAMTSVEGTSGTSMPLTRPASPDAIWLTDWASRDLGVSLGDAVEVDYYLWQEAGQLDTRTASFRLAGIVRTAGDVNASLVPEIPGVTEASSINDWDPPFPLQLNRIRRVDEDFWDQYRTTPKAFIPLVRGQQLWQNRFGNLTAVRVAVPQESDRDDARRRFSTALLKRLDPERTGFSFASLREQGVNASRGSTDFGEYFLYFSSFLIAAAILLAAMFFKLMIEQRAREIGILTTLGFPVSALRQIFLVEGVGLSLAGSMLGLLGAVGYGWLLVLGLRTFWVGAVGTQRIRFYLSWPDLLTGIAVGILFSVTVLWWTLRILSRNSPRLLLSGVLESPRVRLLRARMLAAVTVLSLLLVAALLGTSFAGRVPAMEAFFGSGFLLLVALLCATALYLRRKNPAPIRGRGWPAYLRLGIRNATHRPGRSLICASLIASASFIVISMEAFRQDPAGISLEPHSGTGGFALLAESAIPLIQDPNSEEGREAMGIIGTRPDISPEARFVSFRERPGDDASCLNLYAPQEPRILGVPHAFAKLGRFSFKDSLAANEQQRENPWLLLEPSPQAQAIPAIADANTIQYSLHLSVGSELSIQADNGARVRLRIVAALRDSIFQGGLLIAESAFLRIFPETQGYRFFLVDVPQERMAEMRRTVQEMLSDYGGSVEFTQQRLSAYHRVENTYLSTFQSLGALGLVLGTAGLATILLRNVLERRAELALLRAAGFSRPALSSVIIFENVVLLCWGLMAGALCAILAIIPALQSRGVSFPFTVAGLILTAVFLAGMAASFVAVVAAVRSPLLAALRSE